MFAETITPEAIAKIPDIPVDPRRAWADEYRFTARTLRRRASARLRALTEGESTASFYQTMSDAALLKQMARGCVETARQIDPDGAKGYAARYNAACIQLLQERVAEMEARLREALPCYNEQPDQAVEKIEPQATVSQQELAAVELELQELRQSAVRSPEEQDALDYHIELLTERQRELRVAVKVEAAASVGSVERPKAHRMSRPGRGRTDLYTLEGVTWDQVDGMTWDEIEQMQQGNSGEKARLSVCLKNAIKGLPRAQRQCLSLSFAGRSQAEIAQELGICPSSVSHAVRRAKDSLQRVLFERLAARRFVLSDGMIDFRNWIETSLSLSLPQKRVLYQLALGLTETQIAMRQKREVSTIVRTADRALIRTWDIFTDESIPMGGFSLELRPAEWRYHVLLQLAKTFHRPPAVLIQLLASGYGQ